MVSIPFTGDKDQNHTMVWEIPNRLKWISIWHHKNKFVFKMEDIHLHTNEKYWFSHKNRSGWYIYECITQVLSNNTTATHISDYYWYRLRLVQIWRGIPPQKGCSSCFTCKMNEKLATAHNKGRIHWPLCNRIFKLWYISSHHFF